MRARNIKPGFFKNEIISEMVPETRLLFIGLWCLADREGRLEDRPRRIKAELFAFDSYNVDSMLDDLQSEDFLLRYVAGGKKYIALKNFVKHQQPHYREKESVIPPPEGHQNEITATNVTRSQREKILNRDGYRCQHCGATSQLCIDHILPVSRGGDSSDENLQVLCLSCNTSKSNKIDGGECVKKPNNSGKKQKFGSNSIQGRIDAKLKKSQDAPLIPDSLIPDSLIPDSKTLCASADARREDFQKFWDLFDYKKGKEPAWRAWKKITHYKPELVLKIFSAAEREAKRRPALIANGNTPKMAQGWISDKRWEDEAMDNIKPLPRQNRQKSKMDVAHDLLDQWAGGDNGKTGMGQANDGRDDEGAYTIELKERAAGQFG